MENIDFKSLVIEKAREIFILHGYKKTTMDDIAKACHKSRGLIYHHYKSKEEVFKVIAKNEISRSLIELKKRLENFVTAKEKIYCFFITLNSMLNDTASIYRKMIFEIFDYLEIIKEELEEANLEIVKILKNILQDGIKEDIFEINNIEQTAVSLLQMILGLVYTPFGQILNISISKEVDINRFIDIIFYGVSKR